jgi:hypothetical protein
MQQLAALFCSEDRSMIPAFAVDTKCNSYVPGYEVGAVLRQGQAWC